MSKRNWIIAASFGLVLTCSVGQAQEPAAPGFESDLITDIWEEQGGAEYEEEAQRHQSPTIDLSPLLQGIESAIRDSTSIEDEAERNRQQNNEERDLKAQEEMALWAKGMFWATFATVALTFAALIAIVRTLHHTKIAAQQSVIMANQAKLATKAAYDAMQVTELMGEAQVRAYITINGLQAAFSKIENGEWMLEVSCNMKNCGISPAKNLSVVISMGPFRGYDISVMDGPYTQNVWDLGPGETYSAKFTSWQGFGAVDMDIIRAEWVNRPNFIIEVQFTDVFGKRQPPERRVFSGPLENVKSDDERVASNIYLSEQSSSG